jgi:hypothetical protein
LEKLSSSVAAIMAVLASQASVQHGQYGTIAPSFRSGSKNARPSLTDTTGSSANGGSRGKPKRQT